MGGLPLNETTFAEVLKADGCKATSFRPYSTSNPLAATPFKAQADCLAPARYLIVISFFPFFLSFFAGGVARALTRADRTAMLGKWHLGVQPKFLPHNRGFEQYLGVPYSV